MTQYIKCEFDEWEEADETSNVMKIIVDEVREVESFKYLGP